MNFSIITICLICAFALFAVKKLQESCQGFTFEKKLEKAAKNALHLTFMGIVAVGVFCLALLLFPVLRVIGFAVFPSVAIDWIRTAMEAIFNTRSVYAALQMLVSLALFAAGFSLLFSVFGFVAVRMIAIFRVWKRSYTEQEPKQWKTYDVVSSPTFRKIFLNFANLRI